MPIELVNRVDSDIVAGDHPYLRGAWTPLLEEVNASNMRVLEGKIPSDIDGVYLRNTQNPVYQSIGRYHPFAPRTNARDEDDGYLVTFITNENTQRSECLLIDSKRFMDGPVCRIELPHKLCSGTHSCWANGADLRDGLLSGKPGREPSHSVNRPKP